MIIDKYHQQIKKSLVHTESRAHLHNKYNDLLKKKAIFFSFFFNFIIILTLLMNISKNNN